MPEKLQTGLHGAYEKNTPPGSPAAYQVNIFGFQPRALPSPERQCPIPFGHRAQRPRAIRFRAPNATADSIVNKSTTEVGSGVDALTSVSDMLSRTKTDGYIAVSNSKVSDPVPVTE